MLTAEDIRDVKAWLEKKDKINACPWNERIDCDEGGAIKCKQIIQKFNPIRYSCPCRQFGISSVTDSARRFVEDWEAENGPADAPTMPATGNEGAGGYVGVGEQ